MESLNIALYLPWDLKKLTLVLLLRRSQKESKKHVPPPSPQTPPQKKKVKHVAERMMLGRRYVIYHIYIYEFHIFPIFEAVKEWHLSKGESCVRCSFTFRWCCGCAPWTRKND